MKKFIKKIIRIITGKEAKYQKELSRKRTQYYLDLLNRQSSNNILKL